MPATRRVNCKRNNKQHGGGLGSVVNFAPPSFGHLVQNPLALSAGSSCLAEPRPGMIGSYSPHGLPGMSSFQKGGSRKNKKNTRKGGKGGKGRKNKKQHGGAYGFTGGSGIVGGFPGGATYPPVNSIGCTGSSSVPIPASGADGMLNKTGGQLWDGPHTSALQRGGAYESAALSETLKTAGYSSLQPGANGVIQTGAGTLVSVNVPIDGRIAGGACGMAPQKGGKRNGSRKASRKNRKNKKNSRKNKKNSRKNKKNSRKASRKASRKN